MPRTPILLLALAPFAGCAFFEDVGDTVDGLLDPVAAVGLTVVVDAPSTDVLDTLGVADSSELAIPETFQEGLGATLFLADARKVSDLDQTLIQGASVTLSGCSTQVDVPEQADGAYAYADDGTLQGCAGPFELARTDVSPGALLPVALPEAVDADVPTTWTAGSDLVLDLSGPDVTHALVVVVDAIDGDVTWTNEPSSVTQWFQLLTGSQPLASFTVPGTAFPGDGVYAVVTLPLRRTKGGTLEEVNTALSVVAGGRGTLWPVVVGDVL